MNERKNVLPDSERVQEVVFDTGQSERSPAEF